MSNWLFRFFAQAKRSRSPEEIQEELRIHLEMAAADNIAAGIPVVEAYRKASLALGSTVSASERINDQEWLTHLEGCYRDFLLACRNLRKSPVFFVTASLTLAFGIASNSAIFGLVHGLFLRSLPVDRASKLANVFVAIGDGNDKYQASVPYLLSREFRIRQHSFEDLAFWDSAAVSLTDKRGTLRQYDAGLVSHNAFQSLGLQPHLGRFFVPDEDAPVSQAATWPVVLGYSFWQNRFASDPSIIGRHIEVSGKAAFVIGVAPKRFETVLPGMQMSLFLPLRFASVVAARELIDDPASFYWVWAMGRLRPGATLKTADAEAKSLSKALLHEFVPLRFKSFPQFKQASLHVRSARTGLPSELTRQYVEPLLTAQALVLLILLLCCVNVGALLLARAAVRRREFAIRSAIGAGRWRLIRQSLIENLLVIAVGAISGGLAAWLAEPLLLQFLRDPTMAEGIAVKPDATAFWLTALSGAATALAFGLVPSLHAKPSRFFGGVFEDNMSLNRQIVNGYRRRTRERVLIPTQAGISLLLVTVAILLSRSLIHLQEQPKGFSLDHVTIQTPPFHRLTSDPAEKLNLYQRMEDRINQMSGIHSSSVAYFTPMSGQQVNVAVKAGARSASIAFNFVGPSYFQTMETHILQGREFERGEHEFNVCVLNRRAASLLFPHGDAVGHSVSNQPVNELQTESVCRVIGIAEDAKFASLRDRAPATIYYPLAVQGNLPVANLVFLINAATKREASEAYRQALSEIAPTVPLVLFATLRDQMNASLGAQRMLTVLSNLSSIIALSLTAIGFYGSLFSSVTQRSGEIGIRMALGAGRPRIILLVVSEAAIMLALGIVYGAVGLFLVLRFVEGMLFEISKLDPAVLTVATATLALAAALAILPVGARAISMDPMGVLRRD